MTVYRHWTLKTDPEGIVWLILDRADAAVNALNQEVMSELKQILAELEEKPPVGLIITSGKASGFIAGADVEEFVKLKTSQEAFEVIQAGQQILDQLENLPFPTLALIRGFCMGGGLELALACEFRVAEEDVRTRLGFPEVKLGIQPGWGGTVRLPQLIGHLPALDLILTGRPVSAKTAQRLGLVDAAVPDRQLANAAQALILGKQSAQNPPGIALKRGLGTRFLRPLIGKQLIQKLRSKKVNPAHYPAPYQIIQNWVKYGAMGTEAYQAELQSITQLLLTPTSRNLVRVFFLRNHLKSLAKSVDFKPKRVHVIGSGVMGGDIAAWCALQGLTVTLQDREPALIAPAMGRAYQLIQKQQPDERAIQIVLDRLIPDPTGLGIAKADVIIEAIFENREAKQALFRQLEAQAKPDAILATNTSSIPLDEIHAGLTHPSRLVGIHFFNPVPKMPLVEIVRGQLTDQAIVEKAVKFVTVLDKSPLIVKSGPGFLVNRVLMPYLLEGILLLSEGYSPVLIDRAAVEFGMPMGPLELSDTVGLDICLSAGKNLATAFGLEVPSILVKKVEQKEFGKKSGKGFYLYGKNGQPVLSSLGSKALLPDAQQRMIGRLLNESMACLREGVVENADLLDAGMIFGTGFAPFLGGPLHYAKTYGIQKLISELKELAEKYGDRFKPDEGWFN